MERTVFESESMAIKLTVSSDFTPEEVLIPVASRLEDYLSEDQPEVKKRRHLFNFQFSAMKTADSEQHTNTKGYSAFTFPPFLTDANYFF